MSHQSHALARLAKRAQTVKKRREARVVKPGVFFKLDLVFPGGGENLGRLLGARRARMDQEVWKKAPGGQRVGDSPCVGAPAVSESARVIVAPK